MLVMCVRVNDYSRVGILERNRTTGTCEFCDEKVFYNRENVKALRDKGDEPNLICVRCYRDGNHLHQGYRA